MTDDNFAKLSRNAYVCRVDSKGNTVTVLINIDCPLLAGFGAADREQATHHTAPARTPAVPSPCAHCLAGGAGHGGGEGNKSVLGVGVDA